MHAYRVLTDPAAEGADIGEVKPRRRALLWSAAAGLAAVALGLAGITAWLSLGRPDMDGGSPPAETAAAQEPSLAVLPFQAEDGDAAGRALGADLRQELLGALAAASDMAVRAVDAPAAAANGSAPDLRQLGETLGVRYVLDGGIDGSADRPQVDVRLFDMAGEREIWSRRYDLAETGRAGLGATISRDVAAALGLPPPATTVAPPERRAPTTEPDGSRWPPAQPPGDNPAPPVSEGGP